MLQIIQAQAEKKNTMTVKLWKQLKWTEASRCKAQQFKRHSEKSKDMEDYNR